MAEGLGMELNAGGEVAGVCDGFKGEGEGEAIRGEGRLAVQLDELVEGEERGWGERECANEGIVHEGVRVGEVVEETESVVECIGDGDGTVEKELAKNKGVCVNTSFAYLSVDLQSWFQGVALVEQ